MTRLHVLISLTLVACTLSIQSVNGQSTDPTSLHSILDAAKDAHSWIVSIRRELHAIPELGSHEFKTSSVVKRVLNDLDITFRDGVFGTGIVATIGSGKGPTVALRADMDALPIQEPEGLPFASSGPDHEGHMHACGHDGHMSMVLGAAKLLKAMEPQLPGTVKLVFQPNEEFGAGGEHVVKEGALEGVDVAFAFHVAPWLPSGVLGVNPATIMAGALSFHVTITGRGGHAAMPHLNVDPIVAASACITSLQTLISRETSPLGSAVLSVTLQRAGHAYNVIPDTAEFGGTIRALTHDVMMKLKQRLEEVATSIAAAYGCNATIDWRLDEQPYYPPTVNDPRTAQFVKDVTSRLLGKDAVQDTEPIMGGEDFGFFCRAVPCNLGFLGIRNETLGSVHALHNPRFMIDEDVLHRGAALHAAFASQYILQHQGKQGQQAETTATDRSEL